MAIWQFEVSFVSRQRAPHAEAVDLATFSWDADRLRSLIGDILPPAPSWSENLLIWGEENGDRIHAVIRTDQIVELTARIDLRNLNRKFAEDLLRLAIDCDASLEICNGRIIPLDLRSLAEAIRQSDSFRFVSDPIAFFQTKSPVVE